MPTTNEILAMLTLAANQAAAVAIAWHAILLAIVVAILTGWRPFVGTAVGIGGAMLASVSAVAFATGNPFNAVLYGALAILAIVAAARAPDHPVRRGPPWMIALGSALIAVGWIYPHFLDAPAVMYVIAAPVGVLPCPTLYVISGFTLLGGGLQHRAWTLTFAALTFVYGVTGVATLGVYLDVGLIAAAAGLAVAAMALRRSRIRAQPAEIVPVSAR